MSEQQPIAIQARIIVSRTEDPSLDRNFAQAGPATPDAEADKLPGAAAASESAAALAAATDPGSGAMLGSGAVVQTPTSAPATPQAEGAQFAEALAQFAALERGGEETLVAAGLAPVTLSPGQCVRPLDGPADGGVGSLKGLGAIELLDVGEVTLVPLALPQGIPLGPAVGAEAAGEPQPAEAVRYPAVSLAPHAFPSVSSFISGVVYTSRDRTAGALPSGVGYEISVSGSAELRGFSLRVEAPEQLSQVTVGGEPFSALTRLDTRSPLDVTWSVGKPGDLVVVELGSTAAGGAIARCAFADDVGAGSVPVEWLSSAEGTGRVTLHRQRTEQALESSEGQSKAQLIHVSFDFEMNRAVEFVK